MTFTKIMKLAIISSMATSSKWIAEESKRFFDDVQLIPIKDLLIKVDKFGEKLMIKDSEFEEFDCVYIRGPYRYAEFLKSVALIIAKNFNTYQPISPNAFEVVHNKFLTQLFLAFNKLPTPLTYFSPDMEKNKQILENQIKYPVIVKFLKGTQGKGVIYLESFAAASSTLDAISSEFIIQEYIEAHGEDIRIIVAGDKVLGAMKRVAKVNEIRANIHAGGTGKSYQPSEEMKKLAIKASKILKSDIIGIDFLPTKPPMIIEANISPGLKGITKANNINFAKKIAEFLYHKTKEFVENKNKERDKKIKRELENLSLENALVNIELRGNRILLPEFVTKLAKIKEADEVIVSVKNGKIIIEKTE